MSFGKLLIRFVVSRSSDHISRFRPKFIPGLNSGANCRIDQCVRFRVTDGGSCRLGDNVKIERFCEVTASGGRIRIGANSFIGQGSVLVSRNSIVMGEGCLVAEHVTVRDQNHSFGGEGVIRNSGFSSKEVVIGDNVWIGAKSCILSGVEIGSNCVIGAGSVVTRSFPSNMLIVGNPARAIRSINTGVQ